jgi:hypothetical protein
VSKFFPGDKIDTNGINVDELFLDNSETAAVMPPKDFDLFANFDQLSISSATFEATFPDFPVTSAESSAVDSAFLSIAKSGATSTSSSGSSNPFQDEDPFKPFDVSTLS